MYENEKLIKNGRSISLSPSEHYLFNKGHYLLVSKSIARKYGYKAALLLAEITRMCVTMPKKDEEGYTQIAYSIIQKDIKISENTARPIIEKLKDDKLLDYKYLGGFREKLYKINHKNVISVIDNRDKK